MTTLASLSYVLAATLKELFPQAEIRAIKSTPAAFFCDITFPENWQQSYSNRLEERMREWIRKNISFQKVHVTPSNGAEMLEACEEKKLAQIVRQQKGLVTLLQLDRFFFLAEGPFPHQSSDFPYFKLMDDWVIQGGGKQAKIRLLGVGADSKEELKDRIQYLKTVENPQKKLVKLGFISWLDGMLIWERRGEELKEFLKQKILHLYQGFDLVSMPPLREIEKKKTFLHWIQQRKRGGVQFQQQVAGSLESMQEPWDSLFEWRDEAWAVEKNHNINFFLQIILEFLKITSFDYEVVGVGPTIPYLQKTLTPGRLYWKEKGQRNADSRIEFWAFDQLRQKWLISFVQVDRQTGLIQATLCASLERCIGLMVWQQGENAF